MLPKAANAAKSNKEQSNKKAVKGDQNWPKAAQKGPRASTKGPRVAQKGPTAAQNGQMQQKMAQANSPRMNQSAKVDPKNVTKIVSEGAQMANTGAKKSC